jgi:hypothetical protein
MESTEINGQEVHVFETIEAANQFVNQINLELGIPISENSVTQTYATPIEQDGFIYIHADELTKSINQLE